MPEMQRSNADRNGIKRANSEPFLWVNLTPQQAEPFHPELRFSPHRAIPPSAFSHTFKSIDTLLLLACKYLTVGFFVQYAHLQ
jgi:hypothetical protein